MDDPRCHHPPQSRLEHRVEASVVYVPGSAGVALDSTLSAVWQAANGRSAAEIAAVVALPVEGVTGYVRALRRARLLDPPFLLPIDKPRALLPDAPPLVSAIIVSRNGRHFLADCLPSLEQQSYPNLEIIVVDDGSTDGTAAYLNEQFPHVKVVVQTDGPNFAAGNNLGAAHAAGELFLLVNNDTVLAASCVQELVAVCRRHDNAGGVSAMLRFHDNRPFVNGLGASLRHFGFGHDLGIGNLDVGQFDTLETVPLLCFGAALIPRASWERVGPNETAYTFYYEDADWSHRARSLGYELLAAPRALVYHKFGGSVEALPSAFKQRLVTRNRLWFVVKNLRLRAALPQLFLYFVDDWGHLAAHAVRGEWALIAATLRAWLAFWLGLPRILGRRQREQGAVPLRRLAAAFPPPQMFGRLPRLTAELIDRELRPFLAIESPATKRTRLLIISPDAVHSQMGGVGIRYWELAQQLADVAEVTLATPHDSDLASDGVVLRRYQEGREATLRPLVAAADVILLSGFTVYHHPFLRDAPAYKVVDLYDPMILENLERFAGKPMAERRGLHNVAVNTFNDLFRLGDFYICASEKQRDYWLGALTAANRVNPLVYDSDPTLDRLIAVVPFGLPQEPPRAMEPALKGVWPGIGPQDKVILWGGGLWDWLDPLTVIAAMPAVLQAIPEARLFFLGTRHPNPGVPLSTMATRAMALAEELGLKDRTVFFNEWTPYAERANYLCDADVGVSLHGEHVETRFAVRTRLMDYLWARLPMVVNGGDVLGELVARHELGRVVASGDVDGVAQAIIDLLRKPVEPQRYAPLVARFHWSAVAAPLREYVRAPWTTAGGGRAGTTPGQQSGATPLQQLPARAFATLREKGLASLSREIISYLRWISQQ
jgi:GT2 family glycosyltransferase/glycosyltransferase involved in cell wall biosynthesis